MCGIFGQFRPSGAILEQDRLENATECLHHRGPDGGGYWREAGVALGHRRLAIIDLAAGRQPMASHDGRYVIIFNGEIYNYIELREELAQTGVRFATHSDTEVILEAYRAWGTDAPARLSGMFAFAIHDRHQASLFMARDRLGEKPMVYIDHGEDGVTFASELKALVAAGVTTMDVDVEVLELYLSLNYIPGTKSLLKGVKRLAAGCWRLYTRGRSATDGRYWSPPNPKSDPLPYPTVVDALPELRHRLDRAVSMALRSDVPVTLFLSGGIDSSLIAESAVRQGMIDTAYCLDFQEEGFSEWDKAKDVAKRLGVDLRRAIAHVPDPDLFQTIADHNDDPLADSSSVAVWFLAERTAKDFKVAITGDGGDELFGGYLTYRATSLYTRLFTHVPSPMLRLLARAAAMLRPSDGKVTMAYKMQRFARAFGLPPSLAHLTWNGTFLPSEAGRLIAPELQPPDGATLLEKLVAGYGVSTRPRLRDLQRLDALEYLPNDILTKVDRITMAHGLESRAPFLDSQVADFGLALPDHLKLTAGSQSKLILRALAEQRFGRDISNAKKQGFSIPIHRWLRGPMRESLDAFLGPEALRRLPFLDHKVVSAIRDAHASGRGQFGYELWGLMVLSAWWNAFSNSKKLEKAAFDLSRPTM
jgi:asparagine synthase (glutamine-hydrolysing)